MPPSPQLFKACLLAALAGLPSAPAADSTDVRRLDELVAQLADEDFEVREKAQRALEHLSAEHLDDLKARLKGAEEIEIQIRLHAIVIRIADSLIHVAEGLLAEAREALEQGKNERASDLLCEMLSCLRRRWDELDTPGDLWMKARKPDSHDPFLALCSKLSACSDQTLWGLICASQLDSPVVWRKEDNKLEIYELRDLMAPYCDGKDPCFVLFEDIFKQCAYLEDAGSLEIMNGNAVVLSDDRFHSIIRAVSADIRADLINSWERAQKEKEKAGKP